MNILVLGGCGFVGSEVVEDLLGTSEFSKIVIGDIELEKAKAHASSFNDPRLSAEFVDTYDKGKLRSLVKDFDVVANCTNIRDSILILEVAVEAGVHYLDLTGSLHLEKLKLDENAKKAGMTAILTLGVTPGITNILAKHGVNQLDETDHIQVSFAALRPIAPSPGLLDTLLHQFNPIEEERYYYKDGKYINFPPFSGEKTIVFSDPIGPQTTYLLGHAETSTLSRFIRGVKSVETRGTWGDKVMQAFKIFIYCGLFSEKPIKVNDHLIAPRDFLREHLIQCKPQGEETERYVSFLNVEVSGKKDGRTTKCTYNVRHPLDWHKKAAPKMTGIPMSIGAQMLAKGEVKVKGVLPPEMTVEPEPFFAQLAKRGIEVSE